MPRLVLGTRNRHKVIELEELLAPRGFQLASLEQFPSAIDVVEDGATFRENATKKAVEQSVKLGQWVLAEDSGLAVDALGGAPGVYSARYAALRAADDAVGAARLPAQASVDERNNDRLLYDLRDVPVERRGAHYVCHAVVADPRGAVRAEAVGKCHGRMLEARHGSGGFGYDPLFEIVEYHRTFGQLGAAVKAALSHRARAMRLLVPQLVELARAGWVA